MTAIYLLVLAVLAVDHHGHWSQLHPWTAWFVILVVVAIADLVLECRSGSRGQACPSTCSLVC